MMPRHFNNLRENVPFNTRNAKDFSNYHPENSRSQFGENSSPEYFFEPRTVYPSHQTERHKSHVDNNSFTRSKFSTFTSEQHVYPAQEQLRQVDDPTYKRSTRNYNSHYVQPEKIGPCKQVYSLSPQHDLTEGERNYRNAQLQPRVVSLSSVGTSVYSNQVREPNFRTNQGTQRRDDRTSQKYLAQKQTTKPKVNRIPADYCHTTVTPQSRPVSESRASYDHYRKPLNFEAVYHQEAPYVTSRTKTSQIQPPLISSCFKMQGDRTNRRSPTTHQPYVTSHKIVAPNRLSYENSPYRSNVNTEECYSTEFNNRPGYTSERYVSHEPLDQVQFPVHQNSEKSPSKSSYRKKSQKPKNKQKTPAVEKDDNSGTSQHVRLKANSTTSKIVKTHLKPEHQKKSFLVPLPNSMESGVTWAYIPLPNNMLSSNESEFLERRTLICFIHKFLSFMFQSVLNNEKRIVGEHVLRVTLDGKEELFQVPGIIQELLAAGVKITELNLPRTMCTMRKKRQGFLIFIKVEEAEHERIILEVFTKKGFKISNTLDKTESSKQEQ